MFRKIWTLYYEGFRHMPKWGKMLWVIVLIKVFIMFVIFKWLLMPDFLGDMYTTDKEKGDHVLNELINKP